MQRLHVIGSNCDKMQVQLEFKSAQVVSGFHPQQEKRMPRTWAEIYHELQSLLRSFYRGVFIPPVEHSPIMCMMRDATATTLRICKGVKASMHQVLSKYFVRVQHTCAEWSLEMSSHCILMTHPC